MGNRPAYCVETYNDAMAWTAERCEAQVKANCDYLATHPLLSLESTLTLVMENRAIRFATMDKEAA
jgi:hypothetical protein